ncbi:hypothetical protein EWM64_g10889 [Hericium alpestre]|uniref:Uncharacterized protein n=1 Tax=Hericium alpestre TaxID=135208 RepID=A0A4Y9ZH24_9AGAM|nr:hypothetical protein EWM64_g10889 [Hericium alpestre]
MSLVLDGLISFACLSLSLLLFVTRDDDLAVPLSPSAYILFGSVTHARLQPQRSQHAFTYPMLTFLFSLSDLDAGKLSLLRGWLFSYNGKFFSVLGLRASNYLYRDHKEKSIRAKLVKTLERLGVSDAAELAGVWMMTMPRYLGWNATNALTVYYCYKKGEDKLWVAVFEVHNNFGERHVHVLQAGVNEEIPPKG